MASLTVPTTRTINDPKVILTVDPIARTVAVEVTETCPSCSGYGSPCGECRGDGQLHHPCKSADDLAALLGADAAKTTFDTIRAFGGG